MTDDAAPALSLIEPVPVDDELFSGLALIEETDCGVRLVLYAKQTVYETGQVVHVVKRKIVMPMEAIETGNTAVRAFINSRPQRRMLRLVE